MGDARFYVLGWLLLAMALFKRGISEFSLTSAIRDGRLSEARNASFVLNLPNASQTESYSGFLTANETKNCIFFWYFPAMQNASTAPIIVWLSGGPGWSSLNALFLENGPFFIDKDGSLHMRNETWTKEFSVVYIDQPVNTGFSYPTEENLYADTMDFVIRDLYDCIQQFLKLYELENNDLYIAAQSYGGKFAVELADAILKDNASLEESCFKDSVSDQPRKKIKLKGISCGNALLDNIYFTEKADFFFQHGLVSYSQKNELELRQNVMKKLIEENRIAEATRVLRFTLMSSDSLFANYSGFTTAGLENYLFSTGLPYNTDFVKYLDRWDVRQTIHVGNRQYFFYNRKVFKKLVMDILLSVKDKLLKIVKNSDLRVLVYNGEFDILCPYPLTEKFFRENLEDYDDSGRYVWRVASTDKEVAGYVTHATTNLWIVMVRGAGHDAPGDQMSRCLDLITKFITGSLN